MNQAYDNLYIGDVNDADNPKKHEQEDIEYILNLSGTTTETDTAPAYSIVKEQNYFHVPIEDGPGNPDFLIRTVIELADKLHKQAKEEDSSLLIHCSVGASRSPSIAAAVMSLRNVKRVQENVSRIKKVRPAVNPEPGLVSQVGRITADMYNNT